MPILPDVPEILAFAESAARTGAEIVMQHFTKGFTVQTKANVEQSYNLVTQADLDCEKAIVAKILQQFPHHSVLGEESHENAQLDDPAAREHLWIVDPIDGTNNFAHRIPQFGVSVAYYYRDQPTVGVVINPATNQCYAAAIGQGATMNGDSIQVSPVAAVQQAVISTGFYYDRGPMMQATLDSMAELFRRDVHGLRRFGAASLDLCMVAAGQCDAYFEYNLGPWDFAAGRLILTEAGGQATDCLGNPLPVTTNSAILASNSQLHTELLSILDPFIARLDK